MSSINPIGRERDVGRPYHGAANRGSSTRSRLVMAGLDLAIHDFLG
jgi:hypothetical protein